MPSPNQPTNDQSINESTETMTTTTQPVAELNGVPVAKRHGTVATTAADYGATATSMATNATATMTTRTTTTAMATPGNTTATRAAVTI